MFEACVINVILNLHDRDVGYLIFIVILLKNKGFFLKIVIHC